MGRNRRQVRKEREEDRPGAVEGEDVYEVEKVIGHQPESAKIRSSVSEYLVRWKGWDEDGDTWESAGSIERDCKDVVNKYWAAILPVPMRAEKRLRESDAEASSGMGDDTVGVITGDLDKLRSPRSTFQVSDAAEFYASELVATPESFSKVQKIVSVNSEELERKISKQISENSTALKSHFETQLQVQLDAKFERHFKRIQAERTFCPAEALQHANANILSHATEFDFLMESTNVLRAEHITIKVARDTLKQCKTIKLKLTDIHRSLVDLGYTTPREAVYKKSLQMMANGWIDAVTAFEKAFKGRIETGVPQELNFSEDATPPGEIKAEA